VSAPAVGWSGWGTRIYQEESLVLLALLRTLWRLSYQELHDWLCAWPALALARGLPLGADGRPRVPSKAQESNRLRAAGAPASEMLFVLLVRQGLTAMENERLRREREEALRQTTAQMEMFLGVSRHELRNPLTSMRLGLQTVEKRIRRLLQSERVEGTDVALLLAPVAQAERQEGAVVGIDTRSPISRWSTLSPTARMRPTPSLPRPLGKGGRTP
jgi:signal transduction histidine kinase